MKKNEIPVRKPRPAPTPKPSDGQLLMVDQEPNWVWKNELSFKPSTAIIAVALISFVASTLTACLMMTRSNVCTHIIKKNQIVQVSVAGPGVTDQVGSCHVSIDGLGGDEWSGSLFCDDGSERKLSGKFGKPVIVHMMNENATYNISVQNAPGVGKVNVGITRSEKSDECFSKAATALEEPPICITKEELERVGGTCDNVMSMMLKREREMIHSVWKNLGTCYDVNTDLRKLCDESTYKPKTNEIPEPFSE